MRLVKEELGVRLTPRDERGARATSSWSKSSLADSRMVARSDLVAPIVSSPIQRIEVRRLKPRLETKILELPAQVSRLLAITYFGSDVPDGGKKTGVRCRREQFTLCSLRVQLEDVDLALFLLHRTQRRNDIYRIDDLDLSGVAATGCRGSVRSHQRMQTRLLTQPQSLP